MSESVAVRRRATNDQNEIMHELGQLTAWRGEIDKRLDRTVHEIGDRLTAHEVATRKTVDDLRQDVVHAIDAMRTTQNTQAASIWGLENDKAMRSGVFKAAGLLKEYSPWAVSIAIGVVAWLK